MFFFDLELLTCCFVIMIKIKWCFRFFDKWIWNGYSNGIILNYEIGEKKKRDKERKLSLIVWFLIIIYLLFERIEFRCVAVENNKRFVGFIRFCFII